MKFSFSTNLDGVQNIKELVPWISQAFRNILIGLNGKLTIFDNVTPDLVTVVFPTANVEVSVPHTLGVIPMGYFPTKKTVSMVIYDGATTNTENRIYLKSSAAGTAKIWLF